MSAILSASDLNDFISPGVACIKPVESLPAPPPPSNPYEVITEDSSSNPQPKSAQISLTDCLACSGCVTSAEAVLVQLQSVQEVLDNLEEPNGRMFIALVSPQSVASIAAVYGVGWGEARGMVEEGLRRKGFGGVVDTDWGRSVCAVGAWEEVQRMLTGEGGELKKPILTSACPGFVCYAEAVHPYLLPHLSRMKSPQAILGTFIKSVLPKLIAQERGVDGKDVEPQEVYVVGVQPCFDKKLEGARGELTNASWMEGVEKGREVRDVDCVITTRELITLCGEEEFGMLPRAMPQRSGGTEGLLEGMLKISTLPSDPSLTTGTSGGYLIYILHRLQSQYPGSTISITKGRNSDTVEYALLSPQNTEIIRLARSYGFRNIQNLVRKLKPPKRRVLPKFGRKGTGGQVVLGSGAVREGTGYAYVEVMACPGGCTNGGGQVKVDDAFRIGRGGGEEVSVGADDGEGGVVSAGAGVGGQQKQREWLAKVDEAYWSDSSSSPTSKNIDAMEVDGEQQEHLFGIDPEKVRNFINSWSQFTGVSVDKLLFTGYRKVEDEFNKDKRDEDPVMRAAELAGKAGGGW
ncbi:iron hydrogenase [Terfezia boudieri ATCC MYA-4762]|uniref:Cytosolic Fe-S cluster assembly factor NAR1 n=1 Tax=Terfezia boudieri ATCC MYA-4762 TaxID=1051890 RepID=A0A3N4LD83_9PEZI|nr:iron hydrogenase [Terfezia boudieri ATCC MYA-4762]